MTLKNSRQEAFAQALFAGDSQRTAYRKAYPRSETWKDETVDSKACILAKNEKVMARLAELHEATASPLILDRQGRMIILTEFAMNEDLMPKTRMQALDILNKMDAEYVKKVEATVSLPVSDTAAKVQAILDEC